MTAAILVGVLVTGGVFLILQREMLRVTIGFVLLGHAVNVLFVAAGGMDRRGAPLLGENDPADAADPLPQAFVLTAVVITFGITVYLLALIRAGGQDQPADGDLSHGDPSGTHPSEEHASGPDSSGEHASDEHRKGAGPDRGGGASDRGGGPTAGGDRRGGGSADGDAGQGPAGGGPGAGRGTTAEERT